MENLTARVSKKTFRNWQTDFILFLSFVLASISGVYFLYFVSGGYQGGRNPTYGITILFERETWSLLHIWTGTIMIAVVLIHVVLHWKWILNTVKRSFQNINDPSGKPNNRALFNIGINAFTALTFFLTAVSGVYYLFFPANLHMNFILSATTWDMLHTWAGTLLIISAGVHFTIHWRWVKNVSGKIFKIISNPAAYRKARKACPVD